MNALAYDFGGGNQPRITLTEVRSRCGGEVQGASAFANRPPDWNSEAISRLELLTRLPVGWDGHNGRPANSVAVVYAFEILGRIMEPGLPLPSIMPLSDGGVQLEWHRKGWDVEIGIFGGSKVEVFVHDLATGQEEEWELGADVSRLVAVIARIKD